MTLQTTSPARAGAARVVAWTLVAHLVLGALLGVAWWALAPTGTVKAMPGYLFAVEDPELLAKQDSVFAALMLAAGLASAVLTLRRMTVRPVLNVFTVVTGGLLGSTAAWQLGRLLGPQAVPHPVTLTQVGPPLPAPLDLNALGMLGIWPAVTVVIVFLVSLTLLWYQLLRGPAAQAAPPPLPDGVPLTYGQATDLSDGQWGPYQPGTGKMTRE